MSDDSSDRNANRGMSRRKVLSATGVGAGGLIFSTVPTSAGGSQDGSVGIEDDSDRPEWAGSWRDVPGWEDMRNDVGKSDVDLTQEEIRKGLADPSNWELYVHEAPDGEELRFVGEDRNAESFAAASDDDVTTQNPYSWDVFCWNAPLIGYGCVNATATAKWNEVSFSLSAWGYELYGGGLSWIDNTVSISAKATVKGFRIGFDGWVSLEHVWGDTWDVCPGGEVCVIAEPACLSGSKCYAIAEP